MRHSPSGVPCQIRRLPMSKEPTQEQTKEFWFKVGLRRDNVGKKMGKEE